MDCFCAALLYTLPGLLILTIINCKIVNVIIIGRKEITEIHNEILLQVSKKSCPFLLTSSLYKNEQDFLDIHEIQYVLLIGSNNLRVYAPI